MIESKLKRNLDLAISKGKAFMRKSNDVFHDFKHAQNVEKIALEILKNQEVGKPPAKLISAAAYWHDVYKGSVDKFHLKSSDGRGSSLMVKKELENILPPKILEELLEAILNHDRVIKYVLFPRKFSLLIKILIESDMLDMFNVDRWKRGVSAKNMTYLQKIIFSLFEITCLALVLPRMFTFNKSQQIFKRESKKFWDFFLFKEKYFFRVIANKV